MNKPKKSNRESLLIRSINLENYRLNEIGTVQVGTSVRRKSTVGRPKATQNEHLEIRVFGKSLKKGVLIFKHLEPCSLVV